MEYKKIKYSEIGKVKSGKRLPKGELVSEVISDNKYIRVRDITSNVINPKEVQYITDEASDKIKNYRVKENDIIISVVGTVGAIAEIPKELNGAYLTENCDNLLVDETKCLKKYLKHYLISKIGQEQVVANTVGSTQPKLPIYGIENFDIILPEIQIQNKIIAILDALDNKILLNTQTNDNLQKLINSLYIKYFVNFEEYTGEYKDTDLGMIPESFNVDTFGNVITFSNGYGWNSKDMLDTNSEDTYKVFKMGNINIGGGINKAKTKSWIEKEKANNLEQYISKKGDILMCMTDMKNSGNPLLGHTALIDKNDEFVINQRVGIIRCNKNLGYSYVYTMSNLKHFINDIRSRANSGVQVNLTTKGICDTLVLVPDDNTLNKFQQIAEPLYEKIFNNNNENETLEQLRDTLLPKLMNGEIDLDKIEI